MKPAKRTKATGEYIFSRMGKVVKDIEEKTGKRVLNFGAAIPDVAPSTRYIQKFQDLLCEPNAHYYPGYRATRQFSEAIISWYRKRFNVDLDETELLPLWGAKDAVSHLPLVCINRGDEVLIPDPGYPAYTSSTIMYEGTPVYFDLEKIFDSGTLEKKIHSKTKILWLNFPSNPTGKVATLEDLEKIVWLARKHDVFIAYDNAYSEITFDGYIAPSILQIPGAKDVAVEIGSFSKSHSFAGFRLGWIVGNKEIISEFEKIKSQIDSGVSLPLQKLGAYALNFPDTKWHEEMLKSYSSRRNAIISYLPSLQLSWETPKGGLYIWAKVPENEKSSEDYCMKLLKEKNILFTPGSAFGKNGESFVRISICVNIDAISTYF